MATAISNQINATPTASGAPVPIQPPNEGSTQFVYLINSTYYLVDYVAQTVSVFNPLTLSFVNQGGSLFTFMVQYKTLTRAAWITSTLAANSEPSITDFFSNTDSKMTAITPGNDPTQLITLTVTPTPSPPPSEGSTQFVYQINSTFYLIDYTAQTISTFNPITQAFINQNGNLNAFMQRYKTLSYASWVATTIAANTQPSITDFFGNVDTKMSAVNGTNNL